MCLADYNHTLNYKNICLSLMILKFFINRLKETQVLHKPQAFLVQSPTLCSRKEQMKNRQNTILWTFNSSGIFGPSQLSYFSQQKQPLLLCQSLLLCATEHLVANCQVEDNQPFNYHQFIFTCSTSISLEVEACLISLF